MLCGLSFNVVEWNKMRRKKWKVHYTYVYTQYDITGSDDDGCNAVCTKVGREGNVKIVNREYMLGYAPFPDHKKPNYTIRPSALLRLKLK